MYTAVTLTYQMRCAKDVMI